MSSSFLSRRSFFFGVPNALLILLVVFFFVPFAFRGARLSLAKKENNIKDWLPSDFRETAELEWFGSYFAGERFILATWEGCTEEDQRLQILASKLHAESEAGRAQPSSIPDFERAQRLARELGLLLPSDLHRDWGGEDEIWLTSTDGQWYYLTPAGQLFRWEGRSDMVGAVRLAIERLFSPPRVDGKFITALGGETAGGVNPYYNNPALLTVPLIATVQTGPQLVGELSQPGGAFYPVDLTDAAYKPTVARRRAIEQLTGTLFASAIPEDFSWTAEAFEAAVPEHRREALPADFRESVAATLRRIVADRYDGAESALVHAPEEEQTEVWYEVFDAAEVEPPPRLTGILLTLTPVGQENLPFVLGRGVMGMPRGRVYLLAEQSGLSPPPRPTTAPPPLDRLLTTTAAPGPAMHLGGPPVDNVAIDEEGSITLVRLVGYSAALGLLLSYLCFRSLKITVMIFFVGGTSAAISLSIVWWSGAGVDAVLMSMPSLVYVLGLSAAIHIINYYREEVEAGGTEGAPERALAHGWGPCTLAGVTTAIGLLSLYASNIVPIRKFGWYSAVGVMATLVLLFAYLPAALEVFTPLKKSKKKKRKNNLPAEDVAGVGMLADRWESFGRKVVRHHGWVTIGCLLLFFGAAIGLTKIKTSVQLLKLFDSEARIIRDYAWLEENFAKLVPMELVLRVPPEMQRERASEGFPLRRLERIEAVDHIQRTIARAFGDAGKGIVGRAMSAASLTPPLPEPTASTTSAEALRRMVFERRLGESTAALVDSDYLRIEEGGPLAGSELWRISLRVGALSDVDYGRFIDELRVAVAPVLEAYRYRAEILAAVEAAKAADPSLRIGDVILLGRATPEPVGAAPVLVEQPATDPGAPPEMAIDTQTIFASTLNELLANEPLRRSWLDPSIGGLEGRQRSKDWGRLLSTVACVVIVDDSPDFDLDFIRQHARHVVDARQIPTDRGTPEIVDGVPTVSDSGPLEVVFTGVVPVVYKAQRTLLTSLIESIAWAFALISVVMAVLLNPGRRGLGMLRPGAILVGAGAGAVAMLPNAFPVAVIFGIMGHAGVLVDIGTMMTASVAMGVAVDDTIHFLSWVRRELDRGLSRHDAIIQTYRRVGPAMTQTTLVGGLGLFVFALSTFTPTQRFGTLMLVLLVAALVGDLVFLPALMAGPLGRLFRPRRGGSGPSSDHASVHPAPAATDAGDDASVDRGEAQAAQDEAEKGVPAAPKLLRPDTPHGSRREH